VADKKTKRLTIKAVKKWCKDEGHEYVGYEHGQKGHDVVRVKVWGISIKCSVSCTPSSGAQAGANRAINTLKSKVVRLRQRITEGKHNGR